MATAPPTDAKTTAPASGSGWVLETKGKDPGSLNISRELTLSNNQSLNVRPGTQLRMRPKGNLSVDKNAEVAQTAKWGDDLLVTVPGGGQILLKGFYDKRAEANPSKMVIEQKNGVLRTVEGRADSEPVDSRNPQAAFKENKVSKAGDSKAGDSKDSGGYNDKGYPPEPTKTAKKSGKKKSSKGDDEEDDGDGGGFLAWLSGNGGNSLGALGLLGLSGAKKKSSTSVNVSVTNNNTTDSSSSGSSTSTTVPAVSSITISDDTGTSSSDFITKSASQTVSGTLSTSLLSGQTVKVSTDNGSTWTAATAITGSTTFSLSGATLSGSSNLMAKVVNTSLAEGTSLSKAYVLDTTAPTATLTAATYANTAKATVQSSEIGTAYLVHSSVGVTTEASITSASGTLWNKVSISAADTDTLMSLTGLVDGTYTLYTVDVAGNLSMASGNTFTVDATATALSNTVTQLMMSADTGSSPTDRITKTTSQTISGTLSEALGSNESVYISADGGLNWSSATATTGSTSFSLTGCSLEEGTNNSLMAKVLNTSTLGSGAIYSTLYTLDITAPTVAITNSKAIAVTGESVTLTFTFSETPVGFSAADISVTNGTVSGLTVDATDSKVYTATLALSNSVSNGASVVSIASSKFYDIAGNANAVTSTLSVAIDSVSPTVSSVALTSATGAQSNYLNAGDVVTATATFSESVTVDTTNGTPYLNLNVGGTTVQAAYASGSGTTALTFTYTVLSGQTDAGGISIDANSLNLNSGTIKDSAGNSATLTHTAVTDNASYMVDTTAPTATLTTATLTNSSNATVQSSEVGTAYLVNSNISVANEASITSAAGTSWNSVAISAANTNTSLALTGLVDGSYKLFTVDTAGNLSSVTSNSFTVDASSTSLSTSVIRLQFSADTGISPTDRITKTASQTVSGDVSTALSTYESVYISADGGSNWYAATASAGSTSFSLSGLSLEVGTNNVLKAKVMNTATSASSAEYSVSYTLDTTAPTVSSVAITSASGAQSNYLNAGDVVTATVSFSEAVTVTTTNGTPYVNLNIGGTTVRATYASGSGTTALAFYYTILSGQTDANGISIDANSLNLNSGSITDTAGNTVTLTHTAVTDNASYMVDTTAPTTTVSTVVFSADTGSSSSDFITATAAQTISGTLSANVASGETVYVSLDNGSTWTAASTTVGQSTYSLTGQTLTSSNTLKVRVTDTAGNSGTALSQAYTLDATAPAAPSLALTSDTGTSGTDGITNSTSVTVSGVEAGATWQYSSDSGSTWSASQAAATTTFSLSEGTYASGAVKVRQTDTAGNLSATTGSNSSSWTIDTTAPSSPTIALTSDTGSSNTDNITSDSSVTVSGLESGSTWQYSSDNGATWSASQSSSSTTFSLSEGTYASGAVKVQQTDTAGNVGSSTGSNSSSWTIDTTAPSSPTIALTSDTGSSSSDNITNSTSVTVSGLESGSTWQYSSDSGGTWSASQSASTTTFTLSEYSYATGDVQVRQTDSAGNLSASTGTNSSDWTVDTTAATISAVAIASAAGIQNDTLNTGDVLTLYVYFDEDVTVSGTPQLGLNVGGTTVQASYASGSGGQLLTFTYTLAAGLTDADGISIDANSLSLNGGSISDIAGNSATLTHSAVTDNTSYLVDTTAPTVTVSSLAFSADDGISSTDFITSQASQTVSVTLSSALQSSETLLVSLNNGNVWRNATATANPLVWTFTGTLTESNTFQAMVVDDAGNAGTVYSQAYTLDTAAPQVLLVELSSATGIQNNTLNAGDVITATVTLDQTVTVTGTPQLALNIGGTPVQANYVSGSGSTALTFTYTVLASHNDANGISIDANSLSLNGGTLTDNAGNSAVLTHTAVTDNASFKVDNVAPSISSVAISGATGVSHNTLHLNDVVSIAVTLDETVMVSGTPQLALNIGGTTVRADYASGSGSQVLTFTYTITSGLSDSNGISIDANSLSLNGGTVHDLAGNSASLTHAAVSDNASYLVDTTAPTTLVTSVVFSADTGSSSTDFITHTAAQTISGSLSAPLAIDETVYVSLDNGSTWTAATATVGTSVWSLSTTLTSSNTLLAKVVDNSGNDGLAFNQDYVLDTTAPTTPASAPAWYVDNVGSITSSTSTASSTDDTLPGVYVGTGLSDTPQLYDNGVMVSSVYDSVAGTLTPLSVLSEGSHALTYTLTDTAGNESGASPARTITVDTTAPTTTVSTVVFSADTGSSSSDFITATAAQTISGTLSANVASGETVYVSLDNGSTWTAATTTVGQNTYSLTGQTLTSSNTLKVRVTDTAGNSGTALSQAYTLDTTAPAAPSLALTSDTGTSGTDGITNSTSVTVSGVEAGATWQYSSDSGSTWSASQAAATTTFSLSEGTYASGAVKVRQTDTAGNLSATTGSNSSSWTIDTTAPTATLTTATLSNTSNATVQSSEAGTAYLVKSTISVSNQASITSAADTSRNSVSISAANTNTSLPLTGLVDGTYKLYTVDAAGNLSSVGSNSVTVSTTTSYIDLSSVAAGTGGFVINGQSSNDNNGWSVSSAGDVNGDGLVDVLVGVSYSTVSGMWAAGRSYVVFGQTSTTSIDLSAVTAGSGGFVINGQSGYNRSGYSVSNAGDLNGDGLADLIIGAINIDTAAGRSYVIFGKTSTSAIDLSSLTSGSSTAGFIIYGQCASDANGYSVSSAGDVNGDGLGDLLVGAYGYNTGGSLDTGRSYVVFGKTSGAAINLSSIANGSGGFSINGESTADYSGISVSSAGDVNGDGLSDVIVGAFKAVGNDSGRSYVVFGKTGTASINLTSVVNGSGGFVINGQCASDWSGISVSNAGDVNGDGLSDLIVLSNQADANGFSDSGKAYVVYGKTTTTGINLADIASGVGGFVINGWSNNTVSMRVSTAGDINGDGLADLVVGSSNSYVIFGKTDTVAVEISEIASATSSKGFTINGQGTNIDLFGIANNAGDINGDGLADVLIGAYYASANGVYRTGQTFVVYGKTGSSTVYASSLTASTDGFLINGQSGQLTGENSGYAVSAAGDVNGDGFSDLVIGAPYGNNFAGKAYVILGGSQIAANVDFVGSTSSNIQNGTSSAETFAAGQGDDTLTGNGGADVMYGGAGNDTFILNASNLTALQAVFGAGGNTSQLSRVVGGTGLDTLQIAQGGGNLDLTTIANVGAGAPDGLSRIESIEIIDLATDTAANTLKLRALDVIDMAGMNLFTTSNTTAVSGTSLGSSVAKHQLMITGGAEDYANIGVSNWTLSTTVVTYGSHTYKVYNANSSVYAQILIDQNIVNAGHVL